MNEAVYAVVGIPAIAGLILALIPGYRISAIGNVFASGLTFTASLSFLAMHPVVENYVILDSLNTFFIILNTLVGFTTSAFSASYIGHEIETGHLTPLFVRFYHALFQGMMASMNMALLANNIGVMWVGLELATLMTVVMVGIYRTPSALEAAWKYFILGIVGISLAFFGTILVYLAGQGVLGEGLPAMTW
ncbi:MAG: hydrogenase 4 subunit F, partial [Rhodomicrobium sp.]